MPVTMKQLRALLDVDEPDYAEAAQLGTEALGYLEPLIDGPDPMLASKAAYLTGLIQSDKALALLKKAAASTEPRVRIAVAATAANLPKSAANALLFDLVGDKDVGVRKTAVKAVSGEADAKLRSRLEQMSTQDPEHALREVTSQTLRRIRSQ